MIIKNKKHYYLLKHYFPLATQIIRFCLVGSCAAFVNMMIVIFLVEMCSWHPLVANVLAFIIAFQVSYFGHCYWSFARISVCHRSSIPRFLIVATTSFVLNEGLFYIFLSQFHWPYIPALLLVLIIVPIFTFVTSKWWAFR